MLQCWQQIGETMKDQDGILINRSEVAVVRALIDRCRNNNDPKKKQALILKLEHLFATRR